MYSITTLKCFLTSLFFFYRYPIDNFDLLILAPFPCVTKPVIRTISPCLRPIAFEILSLKIIWLAHQTQVKYLSGVCRPSQLWVSVFRVDRNLLLPPNFRQLKRSCCIAQNRVTDDVELVGDRWSWFARSDSLKVSCVLFLPHSDSL